MKTKIANRAILSLQVIAMCIIGLGAKVGAQSQRVELDVPYYHQSGAQWCWAASATMVSRYYQNGSSGINPFIKVWEAANLLDKHYDEGGSVDDEKLVISGFSSGSTFVTRSWEGEQEGQTKANIISAIRNGNPVMLHANSHVHTFVAVGFDENADTVILHDPSGFSFGTHTRLRPQDPDRVFHEVSWDEFFDRLEVWGQRDYNLQWIADLFVEEIAYYYVDNKPAGGLGVSVALEPGSVFNEDSAVSLRWDGKSPHEGIYYTQGNVVGANSSGRLHDDVLGATFYPTDKITVAPSIHSNRNQSHLVSVKTTIIDPNGTEVYSSTESKGITGRQPNGYSGLSPIDLSGVTSNQNFANGVIHKYTLKIEVTSGLEVDAVITQFAVSDPTNRYVVVVMDSSGSNTTTDPQNLRLRAARRLLMKLTSDIEGGIKGSVPDRVALIDFDSSTTILSDFADVDTVFPKIDLIDSSGGTDIDAGIRDAIDLIQAEELRRGGLGSLRDRASIVVFTDGQNNQGDAPVIVEIQRAIAANIRVHYGFLTDQASGYSNPSIPKNYQLNGEKPYISKGGKPSVLGSIGLVKAILQSGGAYGRIRDSGSQEAFSEQLFSQGLSNLKRKEPKIFDGVSVADTFTQGRNNSKKFKGVSSKQIRIAVSSAEIKAEFVVISEKTGEPVAYGANPSNSNGTSVTFTPDSDQNYLLVMHSKTGASGLFDVFFDQDGVSVGNDVPIIDTFLIDGGATSTFDASVSLTHAASGGVPTEYIASEDPSFSGAVWLPYNGSVNFTLSGYGLRTVYLKLKNGSGESLVLSDSIDYINPDDHGDSIGEATSVSVDSTTAGNIEVGGDVDYFRVVVSAHGILTVNSTGSTDTVGALLGSTGSQLASDDDDGDGTNFNIQYSVSPGVYYVRVVGFDTETGTYQLVSHFDDHGDSTGNATSVSVDSTTAGNLEVGEDVDYFRVVVPTYGILTLNSTGSTDTVGALLGSTGSQLASDDDDGDGLNFNIQYSVAPGVYYVRVRGFDENVTGTYQLVSSFDDSLIRHPGSPATPLTIYLSGYLTSGTSKYSGFVSTSSGEVFGYFKSIKVSKTGKLSAKMTYGGVSYSIKGLFDQNGFYQGVITPRNGSAATVNLQLVRTSGDAHKVEGTVTISGQTNYVSAVRTGSSSAQSGIYTLLVLAKEDEDSDPQGHGYALMTVTSVGTAKLKGMLGDGTKWTAKCYVTSDGEMPVYAPLYRNVGSLGGMVRFRNVAGVSDCDGVMEWYKPGSTGIVPFSSGFTVLRNLIGSRYQYTGARLLTEIPNKSPNVEVHIRDGVGDDVLTLDFEWSTRNKLYYTGLEKVKLAVKAETGQIKGVLKDGRVTFKMEGAVFQKQGLGAGLLFEKDQAPFGLILTPID